MDAMSTVNDITERMRNPAQVEGVRPEQVIVAHGLDVDLPAEVDNVTFVPASAGSVAESIARSQAHFFIDDRGRTWVLRQPERNSRVAIYGYRPGQSEPTETQGRSMNSVVLAVARAKSTLGIDDPSGLVMTPAKARAAAKALDEQAETEATETAEATAAADKHAASHTTKQAAKKVAARKAPAKKAAAPKG